MMSKLRDTEDARTGHECPVLPLLPAKKGFLLIPWYDRGDWNHAPVESVRAGKGFGRKELAERKIILCWCEWVFVTLWTLAAGSC